MSIVLNGTTGITTPNIEPTSQTSDFLTTGEIVTTSDITCGGSLALTTSGIYLGGSSAANYLDDYETGTWTPIVGGNATYNTQHGRYTKIGNKVLFEGVLGITSIGTGSTADISGLPFALNASSPQGTIAVGYFSGLATTASYLNATLAPSSTTINLRYIVAGGSVGMGVTNIMGNNTTIYFTGQYSV